MFTSALRWNIHNRTFKQFQQRLLNSFTRNIPRNRSAVRLARDLIDLIDINDPTPTTADALMRLDLPAGVDIEVKL